MRVIDCICNEGFGMNLSCPAHGHRVGAVPPDGGLPEPLQKIAADFCGFCDDGKPVRRDEHGWWLHDLGDRSIYCTSAPAHELNAALRGARLPEPGRTAE